MTLALLIEQLGLTQPSRNIFDIRQWTPALVPPEAASLCFEPCLRGRFHLFIIEREFRPGNSGSKPFRRRRALFGIYRPESNQFTAIIPIPVDALADPSSAVGDAFNAWDPGLNFGIVYTGLTRDDVGGLRYILNQTIVNYENLLPKVHPQGPSAIFVNGALRPGIERITFVPHLARNDGKFSITEFHYIDTYITNGGILQQKVIRVMRV